MLMGKRIMKTFKIKFIFKHIKLEMINIYVHINEVNVDVSIHVYILQCLNEFQLNYLFRHVSFLDGENFQNPVL